MYSKTTAKNTARLLQILDDLERGLAWLNSDRVHICITVNHDQAYVNAAGEKIAPIPKNHGSLLQVLASGVDKLDSFTRQTQK